MIAPDKTVLLKTSTSAISYIETYKSKITFLKEKKKKWKQEKQPRHFNLRAATTWIMLCIIAMDMMITAVMYGACTTKNDDSDLNR